MGYPSETLSLSASTGGILESSTSKELKNLIEKTRTALGLSRLKYFNLITTTDQSEPKYDLVKDEYENTLKVQDYYMKRFLKAFLEFCHIECKEINPHNKRQVKQVIEQIRTLGIAQYKEFVVTYNQSLIDEKQNRILKTPQEIIDAATEKHL